MTTIQSKVPDVFPLKYISFHQKHHS